MSTEENIPCETCLKYPVCKQKEALRCKELFGWLKWTFNNEERIMKEKLMNSYYEKWRVYDGDSTM